MQESIASFRWDDLRVFLAAYREGSLTRAAAKLGLNQSTTSRRLAAFEEALGARLFDRTPEGLVPTGLAERVLGPAEEAEQASHEVVRLSAGVSRGVQGEVRIALTVGLSMYLLAPAMPRLRARHPDLRVSFVVGTSLADLTRREADLAIRFVRPTGAELVAKRIFEGPYAFFGAPSFAERIGPGPHSLTDIDFVGWNTEQTHFPEGNWEQRTGVRCVVRASELTTRIALAQAGMGAIALSETFGSRLEGLVRLDGLPEASMRASAYLVTHRSLRHVARIRAVWDFVEEVMGGFTELAGN